MVARIPGVLAREDAKEIISLITTAKEEYQARYGSYVATNPRALARENYREILDLIVVDDGTDKNYEEILKKIDAEIQKPQKPEEFYKAQFKASEYIDFMNILENNSEGQVGQFIKKFNK